MEIVPSISRPRSRIPLTSLIDMVFTLLLFFVLTTRFTELDQLELNVSQTPATAAERSQQNPTTPLTILLKKDIVQIGDSLFSYANVATAVKPYLPGMAVVIASEKDVSVQQMVQVLDAVKLAGANEITLKEAQ